MENIEKTTSKIEQKLSAFNSAALQKMYELHEKTGSVDNGLIRLLRRLLIGIGLGHPAIALVDHKKSLNQLYGAGFTDKDVSKLLGIQALADILIINTIILLGGMPLAQHIPLDSYLSELTNVPILGSLASSFVGNYGEGALLTRPIYGLAMEAVRDVFFSFVVPGLIENNEMIASNTNFTDASSHLGGAFRWLDNRINLNNA